MFVCATPALGQTDEQRAGARSLATDGAAAFNEGRYKDALDLFQRAESLLHATPHLLFMARSNAKLGQLVKAREAYLKITKEQLPAGAPQAFRDAQAAASRELASIDPKIAALSIKVEGAEAAKDLQVKIDGVPVPAALVGVSQPIDPGDHKVEAVATGFRAQPRMLKVGEGEKATTSLKFEADASAVAGAQPMGTSPGDPSVPGGGVPGNGPGGPGAPGPAAPQDTGASGGGVGVMRIGAYSAFGVAAVGIGLGTVFMLKSSSKRSEADDLCNLPGGGCPAGNKLAIEQADSDADSARTIGFIGFGVGAAAAVTGVVLLVSDKGSEMKSAGIRPWIGVGSAGIAGRF